MARASNTSFNPIPMSWAAQYQKQRSGVTIIPPHIIKFTMDHGKHQKTWIPKSDFCWPQAKMNLTRAIVIMLKNKRHYCINPSKTYLKGCIQQRRTLSMFCWGTWYLTLDRTVVTYSRTLKVHARTDHIIALRAHHNKKRDEGSPPLNPYELKPHSAQHTLQFIEDEYVEKDDDASHRT